MGTPDLVKELIAKKQRVFGEDDQKWLAPLGEDKLRKIKKALDEASSQSVGSAATPEEYVAHAPEPIKEVLNKGLQLVNEQKDRIVQSLVQDLSEERLRQRSVDELQNIAQFVSQFREKS